MGETNSIKAIQLTRTVFEYVHGNLGVLRFNIEKLEPKDADIGEDSINWEIVCSFYETLGAKEPSRYKTVVNVATNQVSIEKIGDAQKKEVYVVNKKEETGAESKI